ncbi:mycofactocin biosynthesis chaperone MftB [Antrihabitans cavernicola]|uniref:Mycofactocin biosynthesis chaperone MftB n=1 Tax=Antrihabitans cavernicola TaxID=2495913 RepID=A0A5A7S580_9NOCA|nr:mycofactocin biosynthesis chaperone MftB [Spelaeibacter cavernicola]KAA0017953.1 mycofactocin biosynthesis chaperone MftB [Spelaeibacter cavernicola]
MPAIDLDSPWRLHPQVALRPESFGALLYHFGTRKLSFLKNQTIVDIVAALPDHADARSAIRAAGIDDDAMPAYARALGTLADSTTIVRAGPATAQSEGAK